MTSIQASRSQVQFLCKRWLSYSASLHTSALSSSTSTTQEKAVFQMPERIQRSPTDILKALDSTIRRDKAGPHYRYHDDPYLTPISNLSKRIYSLSKESGKRAAQWIKDSNPDIFENPSDDPVIPPYLPAEEYTEESEVTEHTLQELINCSRVQDAATVYKLCCQQGIEMSSDTLQALLELTCFTNETDPISDDWYEETNFARTMRPGRNFKNTWNSGGLADELFSKLESPGPAAYCAIIQGLVKYNNVDEAWRLYQEAMSNAVPLDRGTYNALIASATLKHNGFEERWDIIKDMLQTMSAQGVSPDLYTLNNSLQVLSVMGSFRMGQGCSLQLLEEMRRQGIKPSLASYFFLLVIHCRLKGPVNTILYNILDELEKEQQEAGGLQLRDPRDTFFFFEAMNVCADHLRSLDAARRLSDLVDSGKNERLLGEHYKEVMFYRAYLGLAVNSLPITEFMELYNELVPHVYAIDFELMTVILDMVSVQCSFEYVPSLWTDIHATNLFRDNTIGALLTAMEQYVPDASKDATFPATTRISTSSKLEDQEQATPTVGAADDSTLSDALQPPSAVPRRGGGGVSYQLTGSVVTLSKQMTNIIEHLIGKVEEFAINEHRNRRPAVTWTGVMCGQMLNVLATCGDRDSINTGARLLELLKKYPLAIVGEVPPACVRRMSQLALKHGVLDVAVLCASYCKDFDRAAAEEMAAEIMAGRELSAHIRAKLSIGFGSDILTRPPTTEST